MIRDKLIASLALSAALLLGGCATTTANNPKDPIEGFNRAMFSFNEGLDAAIIKPVSKGYDAVMPPPAKSGVINFFGNISDVFIALNNLIQGKPAEAASDVGRVLINTTIGILGLFDVASDAGLEKHEEDFGQTFGRWGIGPGAYVVIPFFGPRNVRDTAGLILDATVNPIGNIQHTPTRNAFIATHLISKRADLLSADKIIEEAALDKYSYLRDAYVQQRNYLVNDGVLPKKRDEPVAPSIPFTLKDIFK
ncbi:MAG: VacJ family lipoprotein [Rhodocyclaceae bacterium]|nr:VacJ family lipoprotein [Rhodocyclaceae bacterium]